MPRIKTEELPDGTADPIKAHLRSYGSGEQRVTLHYMSPRSRKMLHSTLLLVLQLNATSPQHKTTCLQHSGHKTSSLFRCACCLTSHNHQQDMLAASCLRQQ